jgi:hypothetical protein
VLIAASHARTPAGCASSGWSTPRGEDGLCHSVATATSTYAVPSVAAAGVAVGGGGAAGGGGGGAVLEGAAVVGGTGLDVVGGTGLDATAGPADGMIGGAGLDTTDTPTDGAGLEVAATVAGALPVHPAANTATSSAPPTRADRPPVIPPS